MLREVDTIVQVENIKALIEVEVGFIILCKIA